MTVRVTLKVPNVRYEWEMMAPLPFVRSPKSQTYESMVPSGSREPDASKATVAPSITGFGVAVNDATGALPESQYREMVGGVVSQMAPSRPCSTSMMEGGAGQRVSSEPTGSYRGGTKCSRWERKGGVPLPVEQRASAL